MKLDIITQSRMRAFNACRRLHHYTYVQGFRPTARAAALEWGTLLHIGLEAWWRAWMAAADGTRALDDAIAAIEQARAAEDVIVDESAYLKALLMMAAYHMRWAPDMDDLAVVDVEVPFAVALKNPGGHSCKRLRVAGKIDAIVRRLSTHQALIVEHKTSGADLSAGSAYWQRLRMDPQISLYYAGGAALGHQIDGCLYDVIVRPDQRPHAATPVDKRKFTKDGRLYASQRERDETPEEFQRRLADVVSAAPESYFARADVVRLEVELAESQLEVWELAMEIRQAQRLQRAPRNPDACHRYGRPCEFFDVCSGVAQLDDRSRFTHLEDVHPELAVDEAA